MNKKAPLTEFTLRPSLFIIPLIVVLAAALGSAFTVPGLAWYETLQKPIWTPPGFVFSFAWFTIYLFTTIAALMTWNDVKRDRRFFFIMCLFAANAIISPLWSYVFFQMHFISQAILIAALLSLDVVVLMCLLWKRSRIAAALLLPYAAWSIFAIYLNFFIWRLNVYELITFVYGNVS